MLLQNPSCTSAQTTSADGSTQEDMIFTLAPPGTAAVILERQRVISAELSNLGICSGVGTQ